MDHLWISSLKSLQSSRKKKQQLSRNIFFFPSEKSWEIALWYQKVWRMKWQSTAAFFPGKFHEQRSLAGYSPWGYNVWQNSLQKKKKSQTRLSDSTKAAAYMTEWLTHNPSRGWGHGGVLLFRPRLHWKKVQKVVSLGSYPCVTGCCGLPRVSEWIPSLVWKISRSEIILNIIKYNYNHYD